MWICALILALAAQESGRIEAAGSVVTRPSDGRAVFRCEGTTDLPEGARIDIGFFIGDKAVIGDETRRGATQVQDGKFSCDFDIFTRKILSGKYTFRVVFDPNLQSPDLKDWPRVEETILLPVGGADEFDMDFHEVSEILCGDIGAFVAIADEIETAYREFQGNPLPASWKARTVEWDRRTREIIKRMSVTIEYQFLGLSLLVSDSSDKLGKSIQALIDFAATDAKAAFESERDYLAEMVVGYTEHLRSQRSPRQSSMMAVAAARRVLQEAPGMTAEARESARREVMESIMILDMRGVQGQHELLLGLTADLAGYFQAVPDDAVEAKRLRGAAERKLDQLDEILRKSE